MSDDQADWFVPGRIEVLGKHTDYAGGRSLLVATEQGITASGRRTAGGDVVVASRGQEVRLPSDGSRAQVDGWGTYPAAAVARLAANFGDLGGARIDLRDDLPDAAGLSSSSAVVVSVALVLADLFGLPEKPAWQRSLGDRRLLATYLGCIENGSDFGTLRGARGVGTFGGSEDHTAMLCSEAGQVSMFRFAPTQVQRRVPLPPDLCFVLAVSGVRAEKTGAARELYNGVSQAVGEILDRSNTARGRHDPTLDAALSRAGHPDAGAIAEVRHLVRDDPRLLARLDQFVDEAYRIIPSAAVALSIDDREGFGVLVDQSQAGAEEGLGNQVPETRDLQRMARKLGAVAASSFGAGFGGSVWALVPVADAESFSSDWLDLYRRAHPEHDARMVVTRAAEPAHRV